MSLEWITLLLGLAAGLGVGVGGCFIGGKRRKQRRLSAWTPPRKDGP